MSIYYPWEFCVHLCVFSITWRGYIVRGGLHCSHMTIAETATSISSPYHLPKWLWVIFVEMQISSAYKTLKYSFLSVLQAWKSFCGMHKKRPFRTGPFASCQSSPSLSCIQMHPLPFSCLPISHTHLFLPTHHYLSAFRNHKLEEDLSVSPLSLNFFSHITSLLPWIDELSVLLYGYTSLALYLDSSLENFSSFSLPWTSLCLMDFFFLPSILLQSSLYLLWEMTFLKTPWQQQFLFVS